MRIKSFTNGENLFRQILKLKEYSLSMAFFVAWLYTFPMYGPLLETISQNTKSNPTFNFLVFTFFHALGLLGYSWRFSKKVKSGKRPQVKLLKQELKLYILISAVLTLSFLLAPASLLPLIMGGVGLSAAPIMILYQVYLATHVPSNTVGRKIGWALFLAEILHIPFALYAVDIRPIWSFLLIVIILLCSILLFKMGSEPDTFSHDQTEDSYQYKYLTRKNLRNLFIMIFFWYLIVGLMYSLVYPAWFGKGDYSAGIENAAYMIAAPFAGYFADKFHRKHMFSIALSLNGLCYLLLYVFSGHTINILSVCGLQIGSAFLDVYVFTTLAEFSRYSSNPFHIWGWGLFVNLTAIFAANSILYGTQGGLGLVSGIKLMGVILVFLLLPVSNAVIDSAKTMADTGDRRNGEITENDREKGKRDLTSPTGLDFFIIKYRLTPREAEIVQLLLQGYSLKSMEQKLGIKGTTIKTHLKGIYNKSGVNSQKDVIILFYQEEK